MNSFQNIFIKNFNRGISCAGFARTLWLCLRVLGPSTCLNATWQLLFVCNRPNPVFLSQSEGVIAILRLRAAASWSVELRKLSSYRSALTVRGDDRCCNSKSHADRAGALEGVIYILAGFGW